MYRSARLSSQEQSKLNTASAEALELKGVATPIDLASGKTLLAETGDSAVYTLNSSKRRVPIAVKIDLPAEIKYREFVASSLVSILQRALTEYKRDDIQLVFPNQSDWPFIESGSANLVMSDAGVNVSSAGCVATFILKTWAGPTTAILSTFDKANLFYKGSRFTSDPIATESKDVCLAAAVMQFLPTYKKSIDASAMSKQVYGD